jgi:WS/DGAT/MGAT family acyltransferase
MTAERLNALDVAFLCLEDTAPMHMGAVAVFDTTPSFRPGRVVAQVTARVQRVARLQQRIHATRFAPGGAYWAEDTRFGIDHHIRRHSLRSATSDDLAGICSDLMADPLDLSRPPWQVHIVTGLAGGRFAVVAKFHHAMCDAYGAIGLGSALLDDPDGPPGSQRPPHPSVRSDAAASERRTTSPHHMLAAGVRAATEAASRTLTAASIASSIVGKIRVPGASPLRTGPTSNRRVILARVTMADLQRARKQHGGTVHDVLLTVVSGALRHWLATRGEPVDELRLRALIPSSQRQRSNMESGGNLLSGYLCELPVNEPDPAQRLHHVRTHMDRHKAAGPRKGAGALPVLAELIPPAVHRIAMPLVGRGAGLLFDLVVTTVPMPAKELQLGGSPLRELYPLAPLARGQALAIALALHHDSVHIGLHADADALPDVDKLAEALPVAAGELADLRPRRHR